MNRQALRDFLITSFLLGLSFVIALLSSIAAEQNQLVQGAIAAALSLILALVGALYIIPKLARNIRLEILRFAIRTTITVEGLFFVVLLLVIGIAAWNTGNNLLYLVLSALLAFFFAANFLGRVTLGDLSVQMRFPDHIFAGEPANITVNLTNHKRWIPSFSLMIEALSEPQESRHKKAQRRSKEKGSAAQPHRPRQSEEIGKLAYFALTPPKATARSRIDYTFDKRGRYPINAFRISTKFPAGFLKKWRKIGATGEILVYPKPRPISDFYHALPMLAGQVHSNTRGYGDDLYGIRHYQSSDHMRNIDWKATAKLNELMVREYMRDDERRLTIVFDTARPVRFAAAVDAAALALFDQQFEKAIELAASLANHFIKENAEVEFITLDDQLNVPSRASYEHLYEILRSLATLTPAEETAEPSASPLEGLLKNVPTLTDERCFKFLITAAAKGTIPASVWRSAHVVFMEDL